MNHFNNTEAAANETAGVGVARLAWYAALDYAVDMDNSLHRVHSIDYTVFLVALILKLDHAQ